MKAYYYLYYRYFSFINSYFKTDYIGETVYFFSMVVLTLQESILAVLIFYNSGFPFFSIYFLPVSLMLLNYFLLIKNDNGKKIVKKFSHEKKIFKVIGDIFVLLSFFQFFLL